MKLGKKIGFYIGNVLIGIFAMYAYIYTWILFSWGEGFPSLEGFVSIFIALVVFLLFNFFMLKNEARSYWWKGLGAVLFTVIVFVLTLSFG